MPAIDDRALRLAATQLLRAARHEVPGVALAAIALERHPTRFSLICEVIIDADGPRSTAILLDDGSTEQKVLIEVNRRG